MRPIESTGLWHLPDHRDDPVAGTLRYSVRDGLVLSLIGTLHKTFGTGLSITYPVIHGVIADSPYDGRHVTLIDCFQRRARYSFTGLASEEIRANRAYIGARHLGSEENSRCVALRANYTQLAEWSGLTGFRGLLAEPHEAGVISARYERPVPVELVVDEKTRTCLEVGGGAFQGDRRFEISEQVELTFSDAAGFAPPDVLRTLISPFQDFLTFALDTPCTLEDIVFVTEPAEGKEFGDSVHLLFQPVYRPRDEPASSTRGDMLFTWADIASAHPDLLRTWFRFRREFKAPCDVYFGLLFGPPAYLETRVLLLVTGLSLFLAGRSPDQRIRDAIESLRRSVPDSRDRLWIEMIPSVEELAFPHSVYVLLEDYGELLMPAVGHDAERFVAELVTVRRHLFRPEDMPESTHTMQVQLLQTIERLSLLTKVRILECLDFSRSEIAGLVSQSNWYLDLVRHTG